MKAIYNCVADNPDELTFTEGEVIVVDGEEDQEWWVSTSLGLDPCVTMAAKAESHDLTRANAVFFPTRYKKLLLPL